MRAAIRKAVETFHRANPLLPGIPKQELRARAGELALEIFDAALGDLVKARALVVSGDVVRQAGREIELSTEEARAKELIEREFANAGLTVPGFRQRAGEVAGGRAARAENSANSAARKSAGEDLQRPGLSSAALLKLREMLAKYRKERGERLPITAFKELTGITRKYAIPLTGTPGPRTGDASGRGRACYTLIDWEAQRASRAGLRRSGEVWKAGDSWKH